VEIVAETVLWGRYFALIIISIALLSVATILLIVEFVGEDPPTLWLVMLGAVNTFLIISIIAYMVIKGPETQYKAIITDFNEVYSQGYEIVDREGDIYILQESEAD
jgi:ABC-type transport system involved in multi-copper enzyme maturation permease subunit